MEVFGECVDAVLVAWWKLSVIEIEGWCLFWFGSALRRRVIGIVSGSYYGFFDVGRKQYSSGTVVKRGWRGYWFLCPWMG